MELSKEIKTGKKLYLSFSIIVFCFALAAAIHLIWGGILDEEFQSDASEMVLFAQASIDSNSLINPDFYYGHPAAFDSSLLMIPFVKHFGVNLTSLRCGMTVFLFLFSITYFFFFRSLDWDSASSFLCSSLLILFALATYKLREFFYYHIVPYTLSILILLSALTFYNFSIKAGNKTRKFVFLFLSVIMTFIGCADGEIIVLFFFIPFISGILLSKDNFSEIFHSKRFLLFIFLLLSSACFGFLFYKHLSDSIINPYSDQYKVITHPSKWLDHASLLVEHWFSMFDDFSVNDIPFLSRKGIVSVINIGAGLFAFYYFSKSLFSDSYVFSQSEKRFISTQRIITAFSLFFYFFGTISNYIYRLIPMFLTGIISVFIFIKNFVHSYKEPFPVSRKSIIALLSIFFLLAHGGICGFMIFHRVPDDYWTCEGSILNVLADHDLHFGYSADFRFSNAITVYTEENVISRLVDVSEKDNESVVLFKSQSNARWAEETSGYDRYFLIVPEWKLNDFQEVTKNAIEVFHVNQFDTWNRFWEPCHIYVFDHDILKNDE